jgi:hypothetical protein
MAWTEPKEQKPDLTPLGEATLNGGSAGVMEFILAPGDSLTEVPDRYRNWLTDEQWAEGCKKVQKDIKEGKAKKADVPRGTMGMDSPVGVGPMGGLVQYQAIGCICPPGANIQCENPACPRKPLR